MTDPIATMGIVELRAYAVELVEAAEDLWSCIGPHEILALQPQTRALAVRIHEQLWHSEETDRYARGPGAPLTPELAAKAWESARRAGLLRDKLSEADDALKELRVEVGPVDPEEMARVTREWEQKVLARPGAAERVAQIEQEMRQGIDVAPQPIAKKCPQCGRTVYLPEGWQEIMLADTAPPDWDGVLHCRAGHEPVPMVDL